MKYFIPALLFLFSSLAYSAPPGSDEEVIVPDVERLDIKIPKIQTDDYEVGLFAGLYSVEDFGTDSVIGINFAYHFTEDIFLGATYGVSKVSDETGRLSGQLLLSDDQLTYFNLLFGYNVLPGEVYSGKGKAWSSSTYFVGGIGSTTINNNSEFTIIIGGGLRMVPSDWFAIHIDFRDHIFNTNITGGSKTTHNIELTGGITFFF